MASSEVSETKALQVAEVNRKHQPFHSGMPKDLLLLVSFREEKQSAYRHKNIFEQGFSTHFHPWTTMPFHITLWTPVDNQKINQTQKSIYTLHLVHSSIWSATKVLLHKKIMWTPSVGHHGPSWVHGPPVAFA